MPLRDFEILLADEKRKTAFVSGFGGSGKTSFCRAVKQQYGEGITFVSLDWWCRETTTNRKAGIESARRSGNTETLSERENPQNWYDWPRFANDMRKLLAGAEVNLVDAWNQVNGEKDMTISIRRPASTPRLLLVEGIYLLHHPICEFADVRVLIDSSVELCAQRRVQRDGHRNSQDYLAAKARLVDMYDVPYFAANRHRADIVLDPAELTHFKR